MTSLVRVADRAGANLFDLENFVAREIDSKRSAGRRAGRRRRPPLS